MAQLDALSPQRKRAYIRELRKRPSAARITQEEFGRDDPRDFARDILGLRPTAAALKYGYKDGWSPDQDAVLVSMRDNQRTAIPAGHGPGKTRILGVGALWFLYSRRPSKVITTAPTWTQVEKLLWREIGTLWSEAIVKLPGQRNLIELKLADNWFALGLTTSPRLGDLSATRFQGFHSPNVMLLFDEATGVVEEIWEGGTGIALRPTDRWVAGGNPTDPGSRFKRECDRKRADGTHVWHIVRMDCRNHPNVIHDDPEIIPGAVTKNWVDDRLEEYGSEDSPLFKSKVAGLWPEQAADALISLEWITRAQLRAEKQDDLREQAKERTLRAEELRHLGDDRRGVAGGLDVASEGDNLSVLSIIDNGRWSIPEVPADPLFPQWKGGRTWLVGRELNETIDMTAAAACHLGIRALAIDDTGVGAGVRAAILRLIKDGKLPRYHLRPIAGNLDRARPLDLIPVNFGASPALPLKFDEAKDELWWKGREELRLASVILPTDAEIATYGLPKGNSLVEQLTRAIYGQGAGGRIVVFDKRGKTRGVEALADRIKLLSAQSPDVAHSFLLSVRARAALKVGQPAQPARTAKEMFDRRTRELIQQSSGKRTPTGVHKGGGRMSPYQRRRR